MTIRRKSKEELNNQVQGFFEYAKEIGKITEDKAGEIMGILSQSDEIADKDSIQNSLSGTLSPQEFDKIYGEYADYQKNNFLEMKSYIKELGLLPEEGTFMINEIVKLLIKEYKNVENLKSAGITKEDIESFKETIKGNVLILKEAIGDKKRLPPTLTNVIVSGSPENIKAFTKIGIKTVEDFVKLEDVIISGKISNIEVFTKIGIKIADDFVKLKDIICHLDTKIKTIETFAKIGIKTADDFAKMKDMICDYYAKIDNIEVLAKVGIKTADDFVKLKDIICNYYAKSETIEAFTSAGIKTADDFVKLRDIICNSNTKTENVKAFTSVGIKTAEDFVKLKDVICDHPTNAENINSLSEIGVNTADDFYELRGFCQGIHEVIKKFKYLNIISPEDRVRILKYMYHQNSSSLLKTLDDMSKKTGRKVPEKLEKLLNIFNEGNIPNEFGLNSDDEDKILLLNSVGFSSNDIRKYVKHFTVTTTKDIEIILKYYPNIQVDDLLFLGDDLNNINENTLATIFNHYKNLTIQEVKYLSKIFQSGVGKKFLEFIFEKYNNISVEELNSLVSILSFSKLENLEFIFGKYNNISVEELSTLYGILSGAKKENLEFIFEKYSNISVGELVALEGVLSEARKENLELVFEKYGNIGIEKLESFNNVLAHSKNENLELILEKYGAIKVEELESLSRTLGLIQKENLELILEKYDNVSIEELKSLSRAVFGVQNENLELILEKYGAIKIEELESLYIVLSKADTENLKLIFGKYDNIEVEDLKILENVLSNNTLQTMFQHFDPITLEEIKYYESLFAYKWLLQPDTQFKEENHKGYLKYMKQIVDMGDANQLFKEEKSVIISNLLKLSFADVENYLLSLLDFCGNEGYSYREFINCFDGKSINKDTAKFLSLGFSNITPEIKDEKTILNNAINSLYPGLNINFSDGDTEKIMGFLNKVGGINKGYSILILTIEKMHRDGISESNFNSELCKRIDNYKKIMEMYPEDKIPEGLKVSVGLEIEMTNSYLKWYKETTGNDYHHTVDEIVKKAKIGIEREAAYEFATKPATNPLASLLEIHLLQELNFLDLNDMQKLTGNTESTSYKSRNGTGYHLNIGSDYGIYGVGNINFIQNLCTILPRSGISNGDNVHKINPFNNKNFKSSKFSVFPNAQEKTYLEFRTYSMDDVELFEKNVLFNTYAIMGKQAQKKVSNVDDYVIINSLKNSDFINSPEDLMSFLESNRYFLDNQDIKSKKNACEFIFLQIGVLRAIDDYNNNFIDNELFGQDLFKNLSEPRKNYFLDFSLSDKRESIGFKDMGQSSLVVKRYTNLNETFDAQKYIQKDMPFSEEETKKILNESGNTIEEKWIPYITRWLNKTLLWQILCNQCPDTQDLEDKVNNRLSNIDRIKSYLRQEDKVQKIDRQYLYDYFSNKMSLKNFDFYWDMSVDYVNKIVNLNNFFLKKDDTNANNVLKITKKEGVEEADISKSSIFETGYMREGYNYYQGGSENMLLHATQKMAINYMKNVKNILNTNYASEEVNNHVFDKAA